MNKKKNDGKRSYILTRETLGMTLLLFCFVVTVILLTNDFIFLDFGKAVCTFMYGTFGYASYIVVALLAYLGEWLVFEKKVRFNLRCTLLVVATLFMLFMLFHSVTTAKYDMASYGGYLSACYTNAAKGYSGYSFGGVISGLLVYPIAKGTTFIGAYVIFSLFTVAFAVLSFFAIRNVVLGKVVARVKESAKQEEEESEQPAEASAQNVDNLYQVNENHEIVTRVRQTDAPQRQSAEPKEEQPEEKKDDRYSPENLGRRILFQPGEFAAESYRRNMIYNGDSYFNNPVRNDGDYLQSFSSNPPAPRDATPPADTTYTSDFSSNADETPTGNSTTPSYLYGDEPVQSLGNRPLYEEKKDEAEVNSYTVDESSTTEFVEQEEPQIAPVVPEEPEPKLNTLRRDSNPYGLESSDSKPQEEENVRSAEIPLREQPVQPVQPEQPKQAEQPKQEEQPEEKPRERNGLFNLFSSSNPRLSSERRIEPDPSAMRSQRGERSRENLFDEDGDGGLFGDRTPLNGRGRGLEESSQPEELPPVRERSSAVPEIKPERKVERKAEPAPIVTEPPKAEEKPAPVSNTH
ncbi:MAG: hypothetical protein K2N14_00085, partial [Clostridia bacterium]|nr:hypothetical protein [Clostridia bacterium]